MCPFTQGWHSYSDPLSTPQNPDLQQISQWSPYLARITALLQHSSSAYLNMTQGSGDDFINWLEEVSPIATVQKCFIKQWSFLNSSLRGALLLQFYQLIGPFWHKNCNHWKSNFSSVLQLPQAKKADFKDAYLHLQREVISADANKSMGELSRCVYLVNYTLLHS